MLTIGIFLLAGGKALSSTLTQLACGNSILSVKSELSILSAEIGKPITTSPALGRHLIFLERHGRTPSETLSAIALCLRGSITSANGGLSIVRSERELNGLRNLYSHDRARELQLRLTELDRYRSSHLRSKSIADAISEAIDARDQERKDVLAKRQTEMGPYSGRELLPAEVLLEKLVNRIGPDNLATISSTQAQTLEDQPVATALPLPAISDLVSDYNNAVLELRASPPSPSIKMKMVGLYPSQQWFNGWLANTGEVAHLRMKVKGERDSLLVSLECYDNAGNRLDVASLEGVQAANFGRGSLAPINRATASLTTQRRLPLTDEAVKIRHLEPYALAALPQWIIRPDVHDPLNVFVQPVLAEMAKEDLTSCVAMDVSDELWPYLYYCEQNGQISVDRFELLMQQWGFYEHLNDGHLAIWRPKYFDESEARQADRRALARYAKIFATSGLQDFRGQTVLYHDSGLLAGPLTKFFAFLSCSKGQNTWPLTDRMAALLGAVSDSGWEELESGKRIRVAELGTLSELDALFREDVVRSESDHQISDLFTHPPELYRGPDLGDTTIEISRSPETLVRWWDPTRKNENDASWNDLMSLSSIGHVSYTEKPSPHFRVSREDFETKLNGYRFRMASINQKTALLHLPKGYFIKCKIPIQVDTTSQVLMYSELPQSIRDQTWELACESGKAQYHSMQQQIANQTSSGGTSGSMQNRPPPPR